jgi:hypothetical protein
MSFISRSIIAALALAAATPAAAGVYADDLGKCLVAKTSEADRVVFIQWFFSALSAHPAVSKVAPLSADQRATYSRQVADLYQRLLYVDCRSEAIAALKNEGGEALSSSFEMFGQVATRSLMNHPAVTKELEALGAMTDESKIEALAKEAGVPYQRPPRAGSK